MEGAELCHGSSQESDCRPQLSTLSRVLCKDPPLASVPQLYLQDSRGPRCGAGGRRGPGLRGATQQQEETFWWWMEDMPPHLGTFTTDMPSHKAT